APNLFLKAKALKRVVDVALRQALYNKAIGARATRALWNYSKEKPCFDGNTYIYSSTYHASTL
ncbi:hypothetical protein QBC46DRAFT_272528, partial [Diplogelasinospora grovesii]